jgi:hypothetical protein
MRQKFTKSQIEKIKTLFREKRTTSVAAQKSARAKLRKLGFHIEDYSTPGVGFTEGDFDDLVSNGIIEIVDDQK